MGRVELGQWIGDRKERGGGKGDVRSRDPRELSTELTELTGPKNRVFAGLRVTKVSERIRDRGATAALADRRERRRHDAIRRPLRDSDYCNINSSDH